VSRIPRLVLASAAVPAFVPPLEIGKKVPDGVAALVGIMNPMVRIIRVSIILPARKILSS
jgi:hypothetical protein